MEFFVELVKTGSLEDIKKYVETLDKDSLKTLMKFKDEEKRTLIMFAAQRGDLYIFNYLLKNKAPHKGSDSEKMSSLHYAMDGNNIEIIKTLISKKVKIDQLNKYNKPAILYLNKDTSLDIIKLLTDDFKKVYEVRAPVLYREKYFNKRELTYFAVTSGNLELLKYLESLGIDILKPIVSYHQETWTVGKTEEKSILFYALHYQQLEIAKYLISKGVDTKLDEDSLKKIFEIAVRGTFGSFIRNNEVGNLKMMIFLLEDLKIKDIDKIIVSNFDKLNPFLYSIDRGQLELVKYLAKDRELLKSLDDHKRDAVYYAIKGNYVDILDFLLEEESSFIESIENYISDLNNYYYNDLKKYIYPKMINHLIRKEGLDLKKISLEQFENLDLSAIRYFMDKKIDIDLKKFDYNELFFNSIKNGDFPDDIENIIKIFNLDINKEHKYSFSNYLFLASAVYRKRVKVVKRLIELGADVNYKMWGHTYGAIHDCYTQNATQDNNSVEVLNILIDSGVDIDNLNKEGESIVLICLKHNDIFTAKVLLEKKAKVNFTFSDFTRARLNIDTIKFMFDYNISTNIDDSSIYDILYNFKNSFNDIKYILENFKDNLDTKYQLLLLNNAINSKSEDINKFLELFNPQKFKDEEKDKLLINTIESKNIKVLKTLLEMDLIEINSNHLRVANKNKKILELLNDKIETRDKDKNKDNTFIPLRKDEIHSIFPGSQRAGCCPNWDHDIVLSLASDNILEQEDVDKIVKRHKKYKGYGKWQVFSMSEGSGLMLTMITDDEDGNIADFTKKTIKEGVTFKNKKLPNANFTNAVVRGVDFTNCNLKGAIFLDSFLENCNFTNANLENVDFSRSNLKNSIFNKAILRNTDFENTDLTNTSFLESENLDTAMFPGVILENIRYSEPDILANFDISWIDVKKLPKLYYKDNKELSLNQVLKIILLAKELPERYNITDSDKDKLNFKLKDVSKKSILDLFEFLYRYSSKKKASSWIFNILYILAEKDNSIFEVINDYIKNLDGYYYYMQNLLINDLIYIKNREVIRFLYDLTKSKRNSIRKSAKNAFRSKAYREGVSVEKLKDSLISNFGFNSNRELKLDYGNREIAVILNPDFKLTFIDESTGNVYKTIPKATKKDDKVKVEESIKFIKIMKKEIKKIVSDMKKRLEERLMINSFDKFSYWKNIFIDNPILNTFASNLFWGVYKNNKLKEIFIYTWDNSLINLNGDDISIEDDKLISLIHPVELTTKQLKDINTFLDDYEISQPIKQIDRDCYTPKDKNSKVISDFNNPNRLFNTKTLHYKFINSGFSRGAIEDNGFYYSYNRYFDNVDLMVKFSGANIDINFSNEDSTLSDLIFSIEVGKLDKRLFSEIYLFMKSIR